MKRALTSLAVAFVLIATAFAQNPATWGTYAGRYGLTGWAVNNQRVASQFNYYIDSTFQNAVGGTFAFPVNVCTQTLSFGGNRNIGAFAANASVKIVDVNSSNTETVNGVAPTISGSICTLNFSTSNTHTSGSYILRSGTCGLREALNDMGANGGEVIVDQKFYDDGCTQSTITGLNPLVTSTSGPIYQNQYVHDISNGQDTWYEVKPTTTTLISAGSAPTTGTVAGGTFTNGNVIVTYTYVDALGNQSLPSSETTQATGGTTNGIIVTAPAASTGAVGYIPYCTAVGGSTGTEIGCGTGASGMPNATNCTLTTLETIIPACAITANFQVLAPVTSTTKEPTLGTAHTTFAFQPMNNPPFAAGPSAAFQTTYLPFAAVSTINAAANADVGAIYLPAGYFNYLGKTVDVCVKLNYSITATGLPTIKLNAATAYGQSTVTLATFAFATQTGAVTTDGCVTLQVAATGSSGTFWASGTLTQAVNASQATIANNQTVPEVTTAVSSSLDLTKPMYLSVNIAAATASVTSASLNALYIRPAAGN